MSDKTNDDARAPRPRAGGTDRRTFLGRTAATAAAATFLSTSLTRRVPAQARVTPRAHGGSLSRPVTVVLFLRGGADALQLFAPTQDPAYAQLRPNIGVTPQGAGTPRDGLAMDATFTMNAALPALHGRFVDPASEMAVVHAVGYMPYDRSHFESQEIWETAALPGQLPLASGWINRHLQVTSLPGDAPVRGLALRLGLPASMWGSYPCYAVDTISQLTFDAAQSDVETMMRAIYQQGVAAGGTTPTRQGAYDSGQAAFQLIDRFAGLDPTSYVPANGALYPTTDLGNRLREAAQLIRADLGLEVIAVDHGGWDHHTTIEQRLPIQAGELDGAVDAFLTDIGTLSSEVCLVVMTEFGREPAENGSGGTDHGVGGAMMVFGGGVLGGGVRGAWPTLGTLTDNRFLSPVNDFRDVLLAVLQDHMGGTDAATVFPGLTPTPITLF